MPEYLTPGVYYERADTAAPGIAPLRTDVAAFVGIASRGPLHVALPVTSWRQFQAWFGDFTGAGFLGYAVRGFFENGGRRCWIVRVASSAARSAGIALRSAGGAAGWRIRAQSPGVWGNDLDIVVRETHRAQTLATFDPTTPTASHVESTSGFSRATHVRLTQAGSAPVWKVVSDVDPVNSRLIWVHDAQAWRLPWDAPLAGFDAGRPIAVESVEVALLVYEAARLRAVYADLSLVPEHPRYGPRVAAAYRLLHTGDGIASANTRAGLADTERAPFQSGDPGPALPLMPEPIAIDEERSIDGLRAIGAIAPLDLDGAPELRVALAGGADGLAGLTADDFIGEPPGPLDDDEARTAKIRGLQALEGVSEIGVVAVPDIHVRPVSAPVLQPVQPCIANPCLPPGPALPAPPRPRAIGDLPPRFPDEAIFRVQSTMVRLCEARRDRVALLDAPYAAATDARLGIAGVRAWRSRFDSKYAALYHPWVVVVDPLRPAGMLTRAVPPSGHVAGQIARSDLESGVHQAPANAPLAWAQDVSAPIDDATHGVLNPLGINAIRAVPGRGLRVLGARTVSSDADFRFLNVRRLLIMIERAIDVALQWAAFEPNDVITRAKVQMALRGFLLELWLRGALTGDTADEAFFVRCDDTNNTPADRADGRLLAEVGVAAVRPLEFIVVRVGRTQNAFEITEQGGMALAGG